MTIDATDGEYRALFRGAFLGDRLLSLRPWPESLSKTEEPLLWATFPVVTRRSPNIVWRVELKVWMAKTAVLDLVGAIEGYHTLYVGTPAAMNLVTLTDTTVLKIYPKALLDNVRPGAYDDVSKNYFDDALTFEFTVAGTPYIP